MDIEENYILRDRTYQTKILNLPETVRLSVKDDDGWFEPLEIKSLANNEQSLLLDYAKVTDLNICEKFVQEAALIGDNIGQDEFEDDELFRLLDISEVFVLKSVANGCCSGGDIKAFISIQPCMTARTVDSCQAMLGVYYDQNWISSSNGSGEAPSSSEEKKRSRELKFISLVSLGVRLSEDIQVGYTDAMIKVCPKTHPERLKMLQKIGFQVVACIPEGITIFGTNEEDFVLLKNFAAPRKPRQLSEIIFQSDRWCERENTENIFRDTPFLTLPFLPLKFKTQNGKVILVRPAAKSELEIMYKLFQEASGLGRGYGVNEYPTLLYFKSLVILCYNIIYEISQDELGTGVNTSSNKSSIIGCSLLSASWHVRSKKSKTAESSIVISEQFQNQGIGKQLILLEKYFMKKLGFRSMVNDFLESNVSVRSAIDGTFAYPKDLTVGYIPRTAYAPSVGWQGQVVRYVSLEHPAMEDLIKQVEKNIIPVSVSKL